MNTIICAKNHLFGKPVEKVAFSDQSILILSPSEWKDNAVSNMQIAALLSKNHKVIYVETMGGRMPRLSEFRRVLARLKRFVGGAGKKYGHEGLDPHKVKIYSPFAIPKHGNPVFDWVNRHLLVFQIRKILRREKILRPIVWSFSPRWEPVVEKIDKQCFIFHCVDALHTYDTSPGFKEQFERSVRKADVVFTPGVLLEKELALLNSNTRRVGHGCGQGHLDYTDNKTLDLDNIPTPRVVYAGTLANWVDYNLLLAVARKMSDVSFMLIGYIHALAPKNIVDELCNLKNVFHLGYQKYSELPKFYYQSAVGIVPYQPDNEHIRYSTPTKYLDYLAAGLPIISTRFPAAEDMEGLVDIADSPDMFAKQIKSAIEKNSETLVRRRLDYAKKHSWHSQVGLMSQHVEDILNKVE